ncbi:acetyl-CoA carboxylase carboxyltransferase subunit beta [bacterium]|nr:MAG: acetyl-CoA carboxylase carboxyltransferase subunit beta [bacterium]
MTRTSRRTSPIPIPSSPAFRRRSNPRPRGPRKKSRLKERTMNDSLWTRCNSCQRILYKQDILDNYSVCPACNFHFRISSTERLGLLFDDGRYELLDEGITPVDFLNFEDSQKYSKRLKDSQAHTGLAEAIQTGKGTMGGIPVLVLAMEFGFMGGSVASVVGEKITRACELGVRERMPVVVVSCSGGMRMQEGMMSLMQMMKTSAAIALMEEAKVPFISVMADPTTGGTTASFAMLGDINIAEPRALIGFAGPRVIEQTIKEKLPKGFQSSEFVLSHGMLDDVVERKNLRNYLVRALRLFLNRAQ